MLLRKGIYPCKYIDDWKKLYESLWPRKQYFYSNLNIVDIDDLDYNHAKRVRKDFEIKNRGKSHDLYLKSDTLLLADVFEIARKMRIEIYKLYTVKFLSAPRSAWQAALKKTKIELELLTDIGMLLRLRKELKEGYVMLFINMQKLVTNI